MRFFALHSRLDEAGRSWHPAFEVVSPHEDVAPRSIHPIEGADPSGLEAARTLLDSAPGITAGRLALLSDPGGAGCLARADTGQVVFTPWGTLDEVESFHWDTLSKGDYGSCLVGSWVSEYDYDRRSLTLTWSDPPGPRGCGGILRSLVRDDRLSDPEGRFEVFVAGEPIAWRDPAQGAIVKVMAQLDDDGYFAAWHPGFPEDGWVCEGTMWGPYRCGLMERSPNPEYPSPRHWVFPTAGGVINPLRVSPWADVHRGWLDRTAQRLDRPRHHQQ